MGILKKAFNWLTGANLTPEEKKRKAREFEEFVTGKKTQGSGPETGKLKKRIIEEYE